MSEGAHLICSGATRLLWASEHDGAAQAGRGHLRCQELHAQGTAHGTICLLTRPWLYPMAPSLTSGDNCPSKKGCGPLSLNLVTLTILHIQVQTYSLRDTLAEMDTASHTQLSLSLTHTHTASAGPCHSLPHWAWACSLVWAIAKFPEPLLSVGDPGPHLAGEATLGFPAVPHGTPGGGRGCQG